MPDTREQSAYPHLIPGNRDGREDNKPWEVIELEGSTSMEQKTDKKLGPGPSTAKGERILQLPRPVLQHDYWVRYHEQTHVERPHLKRHKNQLRNLIRQMLEEVALDGQCLARDLIDLRYSRNFYDWKTTPRPQDIYAACGNALQVYTNVMVDCDPEIKTYYQDCIDLLGKDDPTLVDAMKEAADAVFKDYSSGNCEDWADILTARLLGIPKEEIPNAPEPPGTSTTPGSGSTPEPGDSSDDPGDDGDGEALAGNPGGVDDEAGTQDPEAGDCTACGGEGVDEDGDKCGACDGTGESPGSGGKTDPTGEPGEDQQAATGSGTQDGDSVLQSEASAGEDNRSTWDDAPIDIGKDRQNDPMDFRFDPMAKAVVDPNSEPRLPAEKKLRDRKLITKEHLQEAIAQDKINRNAGEASQSEELTARTPHGKVDVHRHTMTTGTSRSVALGWRSSEMGSNVRYPSQLWNGGRVFAKRAPGGSIILDCSGSMSWHTQHIEQAQKQMPNLYVAGYSYHGNSGYWQVVHGYSAPNTFIARYCVLAQKGQLDPDGMDHLHSEWQHTGDNAGADPASLWYAAQKAPGPHVWVSDGMVSFGEAERFYAHCDAIMRHHKIVRVLTIEDAIDYLMGKAVPGWHQCATVDTRWVRLGQPFVGRSMEPGKTMDEADRWTRLRANSKKR